MGTAIVAVAGTLLGSLLTFFMTDWRARAERRRREFVEAVTGVLEAFVEFRAEQYLKIEDRKSGQADTRETRRARYQARSAFTAAIDRLHTATRDLWLLAAVEEARRLTVALGDAATNGGVDSEQVRVIGDQLREHHTVLRDSAARALSR
ncbi:hypothetical protein [Streptomyces sp. NPDC059786]|uniref:hypothetical protein n=1 Tax=Streptomyces sp. NPDC059786 TaxID=3346946 RepID=UPI00364820C3